jgi:hypothetical protein
MKGNYALRLLFAFQSPIVDRRRIPVKRKAQVIVFQHSGQGESNRHHGSKETLSNKGEKRHIYKKVLSTQTESCPVVLSPPKMHVVTTIKNSYTSWNWATHTQLTSPYKNIGK